MDGYERNVELMEIAADSTGQADKQFAKYRDTMEYGLNTLTTKWEQLRVSILNKDFFQGLTNIGSDLLDKALKLDPKKAFVMAPIAILAAGNFVKVFMENLKINFEQFSGLAGLIGENLSKNIAKRVGQTGTFSATQYVSGKIQEKTAPKENKIQYLTAETQELAKQKDLIQEKINNIRTERETLRASIEDLKRGSNITSEDAVKRMETIAALKQQNSELEKQRENNKALRQEAKQYLTDIENQKTRLQVEINNITKNIRKTERDINAMKNSPLPFGEVIKDRNNQLVRQQNLLNEKQQQYNKLKQRSTVMQQTFRYNLEETAKLTTKINHNQSLIGDKEREISAALQQNISLQLFG